jgi:hypothetical protein
MGNSVQSLKKLYELRSGVESLNWLSQDGGRAGFSKNLGASLFYKGKGLRMNLISAGSILPDSTFNLGKKTQQDFGK